MRGRDPSGRRSRWSGRSWWSRGLQLTGEAWRADLEALWRLEFPKLVATATRITRDPGLAEQVAQDVFVTAIEHWPVDGPPNRPGAWLMTVAKRRAVDVVRREAGRDARYREMAERASMTSDEEGLEARVDGRIEDDLLRLIFICCHPLLGRDTRVALTLRLLGGLTTQEIARAQLVPSTTAGQRIARGKRAIAQARIAFEDPTPDEQAQRLPSVLEVVYLIFNEGYAATSGESWTRQDLTGEALRLARMLAHLMPRVAEAHGLLALLEIQASRFGARHGPTGPVLLEEQDRMLWDRLLIRRGLAGLERARALGGGPYTAQAGIAACHARAPSAELTDWAEIARLYDAYAASNPGPVVELNRGIAHWKARGTAAGRTILEPLLADARMTRFHLLHAALAELDLADGEVAAAGTRLRTALGLTDSAADRAVLGAKLAGLPRGRANPREPADPERDTP
ncbi:RNA polymerase sigma factor [Frankia nepalensis]|uniref:Sigma-70 family RNA polymerase sigma factor n=1 Tax=Frankia nepalensis TaxID=1836974 RepID=A0A937RGZ3_9ACTN|nr:sigma-70 family RNA polymerase sigma factor [Frankia nepalensis]MBL7629937.1 sigma-70 family RNA polymerase sigma factor [Frankia nepalensis]